MNKGYLKKDYVVKFWKIFTLEVISEDREDGTYKHFITVYFGKKRIVNVTYRTGITEDGKNIAMGMVTFDNNNSYQFIDGKPNIDCSNSTITYSSNFGDVLMMRETFENHSDLEKKFLESYGNENN